jgi:hypothetical protein
MCLETYITDFGAPKVKVKLQAEVCDAPCS